MIKDECFNKFMMKKGVFEVVFGLWMGSVAVNIRHIIIFSVQIIITVLFLIYLKMKINQKRLQQRLSKLNYETIELIDDESVIEWVQEEVIWREISDAYDNNN